MMNKFFLFLSVVLTIGVLSCVDRTFDEPEFLFEDPNLEVTQSIAALKAGHVGGQFEILDGGNIISGIVVANDKSGNFYETFVIADETGGIEVKVNKRSLFNNFPVGRKVFIKTDGLVLGDYNDLIQLGFSSLDEGFIGIPAESYDDYIFGGSLNNSFVVDTLSIGDLTMNYTSMVVCLKDVQFSDADLGYTYADATYKVTTNRTLVDCAGREVLIRTSGYASFAGKPVPGGKGTITAVMSRYRNDIQLFLRDTTDLDFSAQRCGTGSGNETFVDLIELRNNYNSGNNIIGDELKISGVVISDKNYNNIHQNNAIVQDPTGGIVLRFSGAHSLEPGDKVEAIVSGMELSDYNGLLQINNLATNAVIKSGVETIEPRLTTIDEIINNGEAWESTLVKIQGCNISGGQVYGGNLNVTDGSGELVLYTRSAATFADQAVPSGQVDIISIVSDYNGTQINLRSGDDVSGGTVDPGGDVVFEDDFEGGLDKWYTFSVLGDQVWEHSPQYGNPGSCAKMTGYSGGAFANEDWLISPQIDLTSATVGTLKFETAMNYSGFPMEVYISEEYDGTGDPNDAEWVQINPVLSSGSWTWTGSGNIDLSDYFGSGIYFAFKFTCSDQESSTWEVDNVEVFVK
jgi:hypothetical protein